MKKVILLTILLYIFTGNFGYAGRLEFGSGQRIKSHLLKVSSYAIPTVIDYNRDRKKDLIVGDGEGYIWFYQNFGDDEFPIFSEGVKLPNNNTPIRVTSNAAPFIIDWDNDLELDLLVGDSNGIIRLFSGKDLTDVKTILTIPSANAYPFVYDWDDDNKKDLIIGDANGNVWVYLNQGSQQAPIFNEGYKVSVGTKTQSVLSVLENAIVQVIQWDGKGNKDLVIGNAEGEIYVFLSGTETTSGSPTFTTGKKLQAGNKDIDVGFNSAPFVVNWDNDGDMDLLVGEQDGSLNLFINSGGNFSPPIKIAATPTDLDAGSRIIPYVIDFDNDGKKDLVVGDKNGSIKLYRNTGMDDAPVFTDAYTFQENPAIPRDIRLSNPSPFVYDWNQDGNNDLIVGDEQGYIYLFYGSATSSIFTTGTKATTGGTKLPLKVTYDATPIICDWNNDGDMDIVVGDRYGYVNLFLNYGNNQNPVFATQSQKIKADGKDINVGYNARPYVVDFNKDNKKDLVIGNEAGYLRVYLNMGVDKEPVFTTYFQVNADNKPLEVSGFAAPVVIDWNNDKILDLIVGDKDGYINLYPGTILNLPPQVFLETPVGTQSNNVTIYYYLKDDEEQVCSIVVTYSKDGGNTFATATAVTNAGDGIANLNSSQNGIRHSFIWDSKADLGDGFIGVVKIKIIPDDGIIRGTPAESDEFVVDNVHPTKWKKIKVNEADLNLDAYSTPIVEDWDKDDRRDIIIGSEDGYVYFLKNVGLDDLPQFKTALKLQVTGENLLKVNNYSTPFVYDWDSDGRKDLLVGDGDGYVTFFKNTDSHLTLSYGTRIMVGTAPLKVSGNSVPVVVDWNKDGYKDLIVGDRNGNIWLYLNKNVSPPLDTSPSLATGVKIQANSDLDVGNNAAPYVIDWDKDYKDDLIIGNSDGYVFYYKNIGTKDTPSFNGGVKLLFEKEDIKVNANSRPTVIKQDSNKVDLLVGSRDGYVFLYHLTNVAMNTPPHLNITNPKGTQTTQTGTVTITYTLQDDQWDKCNIKVEYSKDGEYWYMASGTPKTNLESSPTGKEYTFIWLSKEDIIATKTYVYLRIIPNDRKLDGQTATVSFYLRNQNNLPMVSNVTAIHIGNGQVEISYTLEDKDNDLCRLFVEYQGGSKGTNWASATIVGTMTDILPNSGLKLIWLSSVDERYQSANDYKIKITPYDIEYGTAGISTSFKVNNSSISSAIAPKGTKTTLSFSPTIIEMLEPFSNDYDVLITVEKNPAGIPKMNTLDSLNNTVRKINVLKLPTLTPVIPSITAKITIPYDDLNSYETESLLRIFELRENKWVLVEGKQSVDIVNNRVSAEVEHFSVFRIGLSASKLSNFQLYPNPFKDNDGDKYNGELGVSGYDYIAFLWVNKVEIYTIAGELVRESKDCEINDNLWKWDLKNDYGQLVGSGIYIYVVKDVNGKVLVGKVGVIR